MSCALDLQRPGLSIAGAKTPWRFREPLAPHYNPCAIHPTRCNREPSDSSPKLPPARHPGPHPSQSPRYSEPTSD